MKILHMLVAPAAGGAEVYVKDLAKALAQNGAELHIGFLSYANDIGRSQEYEDQFLNELENARVKYFFIGKSARYKLWVGIYKVYKYCKANDIDIYHSHLPYGVVFGLLLKIPRVYTHHSIRPRLNKLLYKSFSKIVEHYVGISEICADALRSYTKRPVTTIMNGVNPDKLFRRSRVGISERKVTALVVGRVVPDKDYFFLAASIARLPLDVRNKLVIQVAGEGEPIYVQELKAYICHSGLQENFVFLGSRTNIPYLLDSADMFLMSSANEGLPIALIEATLSGLPCLVTDVGGCGEVIELCGNGFVVSHGDEECYALSLLKLINDNSVYSSFSSNALNNSSGLEISASAESHLKLYLKALRE